MNRTWPYVLFKTLTSFIFIYAGAKHLMHSDKILNRIQTCSLYSFLPNDQLFSVFVTISGLLMIIAAILLHIQRFQKAAAVVLLLILIGITLTVQLENLNDLGPFFKNVAISGSLIFILTNNNYEFKNN